MDSAALPESGYAVTMPSVAPSFGTSDWPLSRNSCGSEDLRLTRSRVFSSRSTEQNILNFHIMGVRTGKIILVRNRQPLPRQPKKGTYMTEYTQAEVCSRAPPRRAHYLC